MSIDLAATALVRNHFDGKTIGKGMAYHRSNCVIASSLIREGEIYTVHARVRGSRPKPYQVIVNVYWCKNCKTYHVESQCDCPIGVQCKHAVAAIAAACKDLPLMGQRESAEELPQVVAAELDPEVTAWMSQLRVGASIAKRAEAGQKVIVYGLKLAKGGGAAIRLMRATPLKSGALGKPKPYSPSGAVSGWSSPPPAEDLLFLRQLCGEIGSSYLGEFRLRGRFGAEIVPQLLATKRCVWMVNDDETTALTLASARPGTLGWREDTEGAQGPVVEVAPAAAIVLPFDPPFYVDVVTGECGSVSIEKEAGIVAAWMRSPSIRGEASGAAAAVLEKMGLPAPRAIEVIERRNVKPVPVLKLVSREMTPYGWRTEKEYFHYAELEFEYEGQRVKAHEISRFVQKKGEGRIVRVMRREGLENRFVEELTEATPLISAGLSRDFWVREYVEGFYLEAKTGWVEFVTREVPKLEKAGWKVEFDASFRFRVAQVEDWYSETRSPEKGAGAANDWFSVELGIIANGERINLIPLMREIFGMLERQKRDGKPTEVVDVRLPDGRFVQLPGERLLAIGQTLAELHDPTSVVGERVQVNKLRAAELIDIPGTGNWKGDEELRELAKRIRGFQSIAVVEPPAGVHATLRPYQMEGLAWLQFLRAYDFGGILADDMGLGKTVQALAHLQMEKDAGRANLPSLVVAPTSLMANWKAEAERFTPGLKVLVSHGMERKAHHDRLADYDVVVTSYALLPRDEEILTKQPYHLVILDEAQYVKNAATKWAEVARSLSARHRLCMTGTPMENHLGELWSLMTFLSPGYLGTSKQFTGMYRTPIEKRGDMERKKALAGRLRPFILRRKKEDVAKELPPKTEIVRSIELAGSQRDLYEAIRIAMHEKVKMEIERRGIAQSHIIILDALLKLRQVCCDPRLVKLEKARKVGESAKLEFLRGMLPELLDEGRRILLFSQFTSMLDLIELELTKLMIPFVRLTGETVDRARPVQRFQAGEVPLFLISLKAGGTGLNLTAADTVIHYDPWWNPAVEQQATDRAHRIGQDKPVFVYKLVTQGTVEEKIIVMQNRKRELVAGLLSEGAGHSLELTREDLSHLFEPA